MISQLFRLAWNRRGANALILVEILVCFLVLCAVLTAGTRFATGWNAPLGFRYEDVWKVELRFGSFSHASEERRLAIKQEIGRTETAIAQHPEALAVSLCANTPFSNNSNSRSIYIDGKRERLFTTACSITLPEVLDLQISEGRWISREDEALDWTPIVLTKKTAMALFPDGNAVGERLPSFNRDGQRVNYEDLEPEDRGTDFRIVGTVENIRRNGEVGPSVHMGFMPTRLGYASSFPPRELLIKVRPGTTVAFEEKLMNTLQAEHPEWSFRVSTLSHHRRNVLRTHLLPLAIGSVVAAAVVAMVGMGLVGVLWQNVVRRTPEIGLRRALGATPRQVQLQIMGELGALAAISVVVGSILFLQAPLLLPDLGLTVSECVLGVAMAVGAVAVFVAVCSFYPSWLAARIQPSQALQYE